MGHDEDYISKLRKAALLHDIGKIAIPDAIINKRGKLQDGEYRLMKEHPKKGYEILSKIEEMPELPLGALYHHERWDGKGYPTGIRGEDIPEIARIISVADAYDAMTSNRNYRAALSFEKVRGEIRNGVGSQFDPAVAQALLELMDQGLGTITEEMNS